MPLEIVHVKVRERLLVRKSRAPQVLFCLYTRQLFGLLSVLLLVGTKPYKWWKLVWEGKQLLHSRNRNPLCNLVGIPVGLSIQREKDIQNQVPSVPLPPMQPLSSAFHSYKPGWFHTVGWELSVFLIMLLSPLCFPIFFSYYNGKSQLEMKGCGRQHPA